MDDAIKELSTVKFWLLAIVSMFLSVIANLITDWLKSKKLIRLAMLSENMSGSPIWASDSHAIIFAFLALLSYFAQQIGHYWQPLLMAFFFSIARTNALIIKIIEKYQIPPSSMLLPIYYVFLETYVILWVAPRAAYWATQFNLVSITGAFIILIIVYSCQWILAKQKYGNGHINTA